MYPFGGSPFDTLQDWAAGVQRGTVIAAVQIEAVKQQSHACRETDHVAGQSTDGAKVSGRTDDQASMQQMIQAK